MTTLHELKSQLVDGENNAVQFDTAYSVKGKRLIETVEEIIRTHTSTVFLLPLSASSAASGIFQVSAPNGGTVVGLQFTPTQNPRFSRVTAPDITRLDLDEIVLDEQNGHIYAGAAITLDQLNQTLAGELDSRFKVLGADLTTYSYAQVGSTFMTGGMGPQRRYFSDSVDQISFYDGEQISIIEGGALTGYAGTYGWSGIVTAVRCSYHELPQNEIAFALPVNNTPDGLARLLQHFSSYSYLDTENGKVTSNTGGADLIFGLEHITASSMRPLLTQSAQNTSTKRARSLSEKCDAANADGLVFASGYSDKPADEFLLQLIDDLDSDEPTIGGVNLEHTENFADAEQMRELREAVPFAIRMQQPKGKFLFKNHTDANISLNPDKVENAMKKLWQADQDYVCSIQDYFRSNPEIKGEILEYGHLNPVGIDPHNRITFACEDETIYKNARSFIKSRNQDYFRALHKVSKSTGSTYVGGEKSACSEHEMFAAFGDLDNAPVALAQKFKQQSAVVRDASPMFSWRAKSPYI